MPDPTEAFFDNLRRVGRIPMLARVSGTLRVELTDGRRTEKTQIIVRRGQVSLGPPADADCMIYTHRQVWDALVTGEAQPMSTFLRGAVVAAGDASMLVLMRRLFAVAGVPEMASGRSKLISRGATAGTARAGRRTTTPARGAGATARSAGTARKASAPDAEASATRKTAPARKAVTARKAAAPRKAAAARKTATARKTAAPRKATARKTAPARKAATAGRTAPARTTATGRTTATTRTTTTARSAGTGTRASTSASGTRTAGTARKAQAAASRRGRV